MEPTSIQQALKASKKNPNAKWKTIAETRRLDGGWRAELEPSFRIERGASVFSMGSCFARNVEQYLYAAGFKIINNNLNSRSGDGLIPDSGGWINKFTPPSISEELDWAKTVKDAGGVVTDENTGHFFFEHPEDEVLDVGFNHPILTSRDVALQLRQVFYDTVYTRACDSDLVIITLGYVETWYDTECKVHCNRFPGLEGLKHGERFQFKRLGFKECLSHIESAMDHLRGFGAKNFLLTVSPVPLARTFCGEDVVLANANSKSTLRAVCGQIASDRADTDYFPSYEMASFSPREAVWEDDQVHVKQDFVGTIVQNFAQTYCVGDVGARVGERQQVTKLDALLSESRLEDAVKLVGGMDAFELEPGEISGLAKLVLAEFHWRTGDEKKASTYLDEVYLAAPEGKYNLQFGVRMQRLADTFSGCGRPEKAKEAIDLAFGEAHRIEDEFARKIYLESWTSWLAKAGRGAEAETVLALLSEKE
ncbi:MAG: GSCFA domain-containing protein [Pseudomonadota bacterium]